MVFKLKGSILFKENDIHHFIAGNFGIHLSWHPQAVEVYTSESPPSLLPLTGFYIMGGVSIIYGRARYSDYNVMAFSNQQIDLQIPSFSFEIGHDWDVFLFILVKKYLFFTS